MAFSRQDSQSDRENNEEGRDVEHTSPMVIRKKSNPRQPLSKESGETSTSPTAIEKNSLPSLEDSYRTLFSCAQKTLSGSGLDRSCSDELRHFLRTKI